MKTISAYSLILILFLAGCSEENIYSKPGGTNNPADQEEEENTTGWLIPKSQIFDGGPGKDGIPVLTNPELISQEDAFYLGNEDLVLGYADGDDIRAYPHNVLNWHEIINDDTENHSIAIIYCPLTGTGIGWDRYIAGAKTTFGVSGLLYNSNIIPYDRATESYWSQLLLKSVHGDLSGTAPLTYNLVETSWKTWREMYPSSKVVSLNTGHDRAYYYYPYDSYRTNDDLLFPVGNTDPRHHVKERVLSVIIHDKVKAYSFEKLSEHNNLINDTINGEKLVIAGDSDANLMMAFNRILADGTELSFQLIEGQLPALLSDDQGNTWDVFGRAIEGPQKGQKLKPVTQMMGYWFAFAAFYPGIILYYD